VDGADLCVRLRREEREDVVGGLAFLDLPDGRPVMSIAGKKPAKEAAAKKPAVKPQRKSA
jgi:hypothetical protein